MVSSKQVIAPPPHPEAAAPKGAAFIRDYIRRVTDKTFDDFAGGKGDTKGARAILGLE